MLKVQYGCGFCAPEDWVNFDASPTLRFERLPIVGKLYNKNEQRFPVNVRYGNVVSGLPIPSGTADVVFCSHVLEHLALDEFSCALRNTLKLLKPGGTFRFVVPDLEYLVAVYQESESPTASIDFQKQSLLGLQSRPSGIGSFLKEYLGNSRHLWMWDYRSLENELRSHGFTDIRRATFGDSHLNIFQQVEESARWRNALGVECRKQLN